MTDLFLILITTLTSNHNYMLTRFVLKTNQSFHCPVLQYLPFSGFLPFCLLTQITLVNFKECISTARIRGGVVLDNDKTNALSVKQIANKFVARDSSLQNTIGNFM